MWGRGQRGSNEGSRGLEGQTGLAERELGIVMKKMGNKIEANHTADGNKSREFRILIH